MFDQYLKRWGLTVDGDAFDSLNGHLLPVRQRGLPATLKISRTQEEQAGNRLMAWWEGEGAAPVLAHDGEALLMERASGPASLTQLVNDGQDEQATRILCAVAARLHTPRAKPSPALAPLEQCFESLWRAAALHRGIFAQSETTARELFKTPRDLRVLHGDIHHGNVLDFGPKGWLAIDPKGLYEERGFDYANIFCNPDRQHALSPACFAHRVETVAQCANLERRRLLQWVLAWAGLSAAWMLEDNIEPAVPLGVAQLAASALGS